MKKIVSVITAIALVFGASCAALASSYGFDTPSYSENSGRTSNFDGAIDGYAPSSVTAGGTVEAVSGWLELARTNEDGELYYQDYVNGVYGIDGGLEFKLKKSAANVGFEIITFGGGYFVYTKWDKDGKLYAKYRDNDAALTNDSYRYICDIEGIEAKITFYIYQNERAYSIAVNDKMVSKLLYSQTSGTPKNELFRINVLKGSVGDKVSIDYKKTGPFSTHALNFDSTSIDTSNAETENTINITTRFIGQAAAPSSNYKVYNAIYDSVDKLVAVNIKPVSEAVRENESNYCTLTGSVNIGSYDYRTLHAKTMLVDSGFRPIMPTDSVYFLSVPTDLEPINNVNPLGYGGDKYEGVATGLYGYGDTSMYIKRTVDHEFDKTIPEDDNTAELLYYTVYANRAYPIEGAGALKFTLYKSNPDFTGHFVVLPCNFIDLVWEDNGDIKVCYRNTAEEEGPDAQYTTVTNVGNKTELDMFIGFDVKTSKYSMWIDGKPVVADKYSHAVYNNQHVVPNKVEFVRLYTEYGKAGDEFGIKNYGTYKAAGFGK